MSRHPAVESILEWFDYMHLPDGPVRQTSMEIYGVVQNLINTLPDDPETTVGLRKLLEAKDCFVRAQVRQQRSADHAR